MSTPAIDYEALAKQFGGVAAPNVDYTALAKQFGGSPAQPQTAIPGTDKTGAPPPIAAPPTPGDLKPDDPSWNLHDFITGKGGMIRTGVDQITGGVERMAQPGRDAKYEGANQILKGAGTAMTPALIGTTIPALAAAPVVTAAGIVGGVGGAYAGGQTARAVTSAAGGSPAAQDLAETGGNVVGGATGAAIGARAGSSASVLGKSIIAKTKAAFEPDPTIGLVKVYRPTPSDSGFSERLPDTVAQIKAANPGPITGNEDVIAATQNAIKSHQDHLENAWMAPARARGVQVPGDSIAQAAIDAIPQSMWREDPATAQAIVARANQGYAKQNLSVDQLRDLLKEKNADLKGFYDRSQGKQNASITSGDPQAVVKAQRDEIAARLYNALDPEGAGAGPRQIQSQTGDMIDLLEAAQRRRNAIMAEKPVSPAARLGKLAAATLDLPGKALHGDIEGGLSKLRSTRYGDSDPMIADIFRNTGTPQPLPSPNPPPVTAGLLGPGAIRTPPPADTSGPIPSAPRPGAGFSQSTGARTLPPAGSPIRNMPPVPDTSGPIKGREPRPGAGMGQTGAKELPKPSRFQQPGFATGTLDDAIPVVGDDGKVVYVPKWTLQNPPPSPPGTMPPPR